MFGMSGRLTGLIGELVLDSVTRQQSPSLSLAVGHFSEQRIPKRRANQRCHLGLGVWERHPLLEDNGK